MPITQHSVGAGLVAAVMVGALSAGCQQQQTFDARAIAIDKYKGDTAPFESAVKACADELDAKGSCGGKASQLITTTPSQADYLDAARCQVEARKATDLPACAAVTQAASIFDLIHLQRPAGRFDEAKARKEWGDRFIDIGSKP